MIIHIPHSSLNVPIEFVDSYRDIPEYVIKRHTDMYTDDIFINGDTGRNVGRVGVKYMVFPYSRFFCDVERLIDDPLEEHGNGFFYTKVPQSNIEFRNKQTNKKEYDAVRERYNDWHEYLRDIVMTSAKKLSRRIIVDCHSFSSVQVLGDTDDIPDICIGANTDGSTTDELLNLVVDGFTSLGYKVKVNSPFSNSMRPMGLDPDMVDTIMIEINKSLYLDNEFDMILDTYNGERFRTLCDDVSNIMSRILFLQETYTI